MTNWPDLFTMPPPTLRGSIGIPVFILASGLQYDCHHYLSALQKYTVPEHPAFEKVICPHYFAECVIYLSLAIVAAPSGSLLNWTIACALCFVVVNLGVTADGTRDWYLRRFGHDAVSRRWRMIPLLY